MSEHKLPLDVRKKHGLVGVRNVPRSLPAEVKRAIQRRQRAKLRGEHRPQSIRLPALPILRGADA